MSPQQRHADTSACHTINQTHHIERVSMRILVVDDDVLNRDMLEGYLMAIGYDPVLAHGGQQALKMLEDFTPELILLDVRMPDMSGYEFCQIVRNNPTTAHIPVVMMTALELTDTDLATMEQAGANGVIPRGLKLNEFQAQIQQYLPDA